MKNKTLLRFTYCVLLTAYCLLVASCGATRKLSSKEFLLVKNKIEVDSGKVNKEELSKYIRQKPNRKILGFVRFHLWVYNLVDLNKVEARKKELKEKREVKNQKRVAKNKEPKAPRRSFGEWMLSIGEAPVVLDSTLTLSTRKQFEIYLKNKGFFNAEVSDSVEYKRKKVRVTYYIKPHIPYTVKNFVYAVYNPELDSIISGSDKPNSLLKAGMNYDVDILQKERERIAKELKNRDYYYFSTENVVFQADTTLGNREVEVTLLIRSNMEKDFGRPDTTNSPKEFRPYRIGRVIINSEYYPKNSSAVPYDTLVYNKNLLAYRNKWTIDPKILTNSVFFKAGELYIARDLENSYRQLSSLKIYKFINIQFEEQENDKLDCIIQLTPAPRQSFSVEAQGTNTGGFPGLFADVIYQNKNIFRGAETFEFRIKGGLESQVVFDDSEDNKTPIFNTLQIGPEASLTIPRFLFPFAKKIKVSRYFRPQTKIRFAYDYQKRPDFTRTIFRTTYGYDWRASNRTRWTYNPIEVNFVNLPPEKQSAAFKERISGINDQLLKNTFISHITWSGVLTYLYTNQDVDKKTNFWYVRLTGESSGLLPYGISSISNAVGGAEKNENGSYLVFNTPYAQYVKFDFDIRRYFAINKRSTFVLRFAAGRGMPYGNLSVLPYEASFFGGGANGIRAWRARRLGPGSYPNTLQSSIDQFGDMRLEMNAEYRFDIYKYFKMAVFADAGNIWLVHKDANRPGAEMEWPRLFKEIALGAGVGARLDFNFFIIRLDGAYPIYDPGKPEADNQRWIGVNEPLLLKKVVWNLGIGYPF
ncbi:MAG: BamA/TamA family outer membrane protein [Bacteroidia bacterium]